MPDLSKEECTACRADAPPVTVDEQHHLLHELPEWRVVDKDDEPKLERVYKFENFVHALAFTNKVGEIAENAGHHPALLTEWGKVTVRWWTHKIRNLHRNDFIMAARSDEAFSRLSDG